MQMQMLSLCVFIAFDFICIWHIQFNSISCHFVVWLFKLYTSFVLHFESTGCNLLMAMVLWFYNSDRLNSILPPLFYRLFLPFDRIRYFWMDYKVIGDNGTEYVIPLDDMTNKFVAILLFTWFPIFCMCCQILLRFSNFNVYYKWFHEINETMNRIKRQKIHSEIFTCHYLKRARAWYGNEEANEVNSDSNEKKMIKI